MPTFTTPSSWRHSRSPGGTRDSASDRCLRNQPFAGEEEEREKAAKPSTWDGMRGHVVAMSGELVGTVLFLWFAFAGNQVASQSTPASTVLEPQGIMFIALSYGMSLLVVAWAFYRISGGLFNPAVTFGMMVSGALPWVRGCLLIPAQIAGAIIAAGLNTCMLPGPIAVITTLTNGTSVRQGLFIEAFLTSLLVFVILMLAAEKHATTHIAPVGIGLALFAAELAGVYFTGGSLNPARSFGPSVVTGDFPHYHWIYWLGPLLGGLAAGAFYRWIKFMNYEQINAGQDASSEEERLKAVQRQKTMGSLRRKTEGEMQGAGIV